MKIRAAEIAERLAAQAEQVASMLLAGGKRQGNYWIAGDVTGAPGESLRVYITGTKAGRWRDYAGEAGGDLLDLWVESNGLAMPDAMREAAEWLGIAPDPIREPTRQYQRPEKKFGALKREHLNWLGGRALEQETIDAYGPGSDGDWIAFPYLVDGRLMRIKYRTIDKRFRQAPDCQPCLFGWQAIPPKARKVCLVEGELDCMAMHQYGMPTLSVPDGGGRKQSHWIEYEFDRLQRFDVIYVALDSDEPGQEAAAEIMDRLGAERCRLVELPKKDTNDCLMAGVTKDQMRECFRRATTVDPEELKTPEDYRQQLHDEFDGPPDREIGFGPPFQSVSDELRFRPGEVVILAGHNGTGKSQLCGHLMLEAMRSGIRTCIASMEMKPSRYLKRLARQSGASDELTREYRDVIVDWWNENLWIFDLVGTAKYQRMLEVFAYARRRYNVRVFLVDNLAKCGFAEDDYNGQKEFVDMLGDFAKQHDSTVILVHHMRKHGDGKLAIKGSGAITDMADTVLIVSRNKAKEDALRENPGDPEWIDKPDGVLRCEKQRNGESEPVKKMWFDHKSFQFLSSSQSRPFRYVGWSAYQESEAVA